MQRFIYETVPGNKVFSSKKRAVDYMLSVNGNKGAIKECLSWKNRNWTELHFPCGYHIIKKPLNEV